MADVFISYKSEDRGRAEEIAQALEDDGFDVWWDPALVTGEDYQQTIHDNLRVAKVAVVLWSKQSVASRWVNAEATFASDSGIWLAPVMIERCEVRTPFNVLQSKDLTSWRGDRADPVWRSLVSDLRHKIGTAPAATGTAARRGVQRSRPRGNPAAFALLGVVGAAAVAAIAFVMMGGVSLFGAPTRVADTAVVLEAPIAAAEPAPVEPAPASPPSAAAPVEMQPVQDAAPAPRPVRPREPGVFRDGNLTLRVERVLITHTQQSPSYIVRGQITMIAENAGDEPIELIAVSPLRMLALTLDTGVVLDGNVHASALGIGSCSRTAEICYTARPDRFTRVNPNDSVMLRLTLETPRLVPPGVARLDEVRAGDLVGRFHVWEGGRGRTASFSFAGLPMD